MKNMTLVKGTQILLVLVALLVLSTPIPATAAQSAQRHELPEFKYDSAVRFDGNVISISDAQGETIVSRNMDAGSNEIQFDNGTLRVEFNYKGIKVMPRFWTFYGNDGTTISGGFRN